LSTSKAIVPASKNLDNILKIKMPAVGVDIGGTKIMAAVVNCEGLIGDPVKIPTPSGPTNILNTILKLVEKFKEDHVLAGVGIATAGIVNVDTGTIIGATGNLPGWTGTPVKQFIESKILLPVHVENDANAAAYAETHLKKFKDQAAVIILTIGTGIGGGILINGQLFRGQHYAAGHCGHIKLSLDNKRLCSCGLFDCFEAYASGTGLLITAKEMLANISAHQSSLATALKNSNGLSNEAVFEAFANQDLIAIQIINTWHKHLAAGISSLAHVLNPDCFILGGGLSKFINLDLLLELVRDITLPAIAGNVKIYRSEFGNTAGLIGAAQLLLDKLAKAER
jgi:glucokinase